jgi:predicted nucleic acid-binding protein
VALILDTGPLLAAMDASDRDHSASAALLAEAREPLVLPAPTLSELDYLLHRGLGNDAFPRLMDEIVAGAFRVENLTLADYARTVEIMRTYADLDVGFIDASVLAVTERLREPKLATLDRRHFTIMRPRHVEALELLPS